MNAITGKIAEGQGTMGQLVQSDETSKNLNEALVAVKEGVDSLTGAMTKVKTWNLDFALRGEYLGSIDKGQGYFSVDLAKVGSPRFYRLELASLPFGVRRDTATITTTTYPDGHTEVIREDEVEYRDTVAFSAEVGYRLGNWIGRAGMIENSGGAGIDYLTLKDRLRFSAEMWDFGGDDDMNPHAKLSGRFYISPSVFVTGGWDDLLNTKADRDSWFLGAGVRWGDDDMKYLAGAVY
jgi:phospholipid/cholesterol/gamma-HCH transport system substrate-binding protein